MKKRKEENELKLNDYFSFLFNFHILGFVEEFNNYIGIWSFESLKYDIGGLIFGSIIYIK